MFGKTKTDEVKDHAEVALELARDKKFRRELLSAVGHGHAAQRRASASTGRTATLKRLAADERLRSELSDMAESLRHAKGRAEKKRSGGRLRKTLLFAGAATAAVAIPQVRTRLGGVIGAFTGGGPRVITETIDVELPATTVYNQWTQFEDFPKFMEGVEEVRQLDDTRLHWVASVAGKRAEWDAKILEQHPDTQVSWVSEDGRATRGTVSFEELSESRTRVTLSLSYMARGFREAIGSALALDTRRVRGDLERFKAMIEARGTETGAWRGEIHAGATQ